MFWLQNSPPGIFTFFFVASSLSQSDCPDFVLIILFTPLFLPTPEGVFHPENQLFCCLGHCCSLFFYRINHVVFPPHSAHIVGVLKLKYWYRLFIKMYFAALQEVQSDKCKLLSFPVLVWRLVKIWVAERPQIVFVLFLSPHKSWFRWKALVSEHHLTMLILMHMLFFFSRRLSSPRSFFSDENTAKGKSLAGSYNILKNCSFCFWVLIRYGRNYYLSVPFREKYYLTLLSVWVTFNTLA